ncbi:PREDICTED: chromatin assembly factor 1 subunit A isoform X2 [Cyphomyrmex costatus]|uniref:chromatin assembly factor 1 subunit A isoform X2 n=1 Tax=Cyphomyrmex costatus TaxID=456900 RepID=UPI0008522E36|nr:PREDICTED: chromatin assembly factor 1 subunit A isoform X2 [Cyphomyrmex costatus]
MYENSGKDRKRSFFMMCQRGLWRKDKKTLEVERERSPDESPVSGEDECVTCMSAKAIMRYVPCNHCPVCRLCFFRIVQVAVSQMRLPMKCMMCRADILGVRPEIPQPDIVYMPNRSWLFPQSASEYNIDPSKYSAACGESGFRRTRSVPASASSYSMASTSSSVSGASSVLSATSSTSTSFNKPTRATRVTRVQQPTGVILRRSQKQEHHDLIQQIPEEASSQENRERRLPPIKEFQREYRAGKASARIRCAQKIVTQLDVSTNPRGTSTSTSLASSSLSCNRAVYNASTKRPLTMPKKMSVVQEVQKAKKEKKLRKEKEKAEKIRQKEEKKAENIKQKEAKKLAKEEEKKEAKTRQKETENIPLLKD